SLVVTTFAHTSWQATLLMPILTFSISLAVGLSATIIQVTVPNELRGRVLGVHGLMWTGLMPSSALGLGVLADQIGLRLTLRLMGTAYFVLAVPWLIRAGIGRRP